MAHYVHRHARLGASVLISASWYNLDDRQQAIVSGRDPILWFHIGDTLEWLEVHEHVTGVGKVTTELLTALLADKQGQPWHLCVETDGDLLPYSPGKSPGLATKSAAAADFLNVLRAAPATDEALRAGDHVLFTGIVWTPTYITLFNQLRARGVRISVLVYDMIPIEHPNFVGAAHSHGFAKWLRVVVSDAELIITSAEHVRSQLHRWATAEGLAPRNPVQVVRFGNSLARFSNAVTASPVEGNFVLCVGTIDRRKNQAFLCQAWAKLGTERSLPVLVLVGRDDADLTRNHTELATLVAAGGIRILSKLDDATLDALYRDALFTVFPSLSEGYGLPVSDSLAYGKLCLASDIDVVREWAGDLPWYFNPTDTGSLLTQLRRALDDPAKVANADAQIATWQPHTWRQSAYDIRKAIDAKSHHHKSAPMVPFQSPVPLRLPTADILENAQRWCVTESPDVSIVVVNWNTTAMTLACIRHLWAKTTGVSYEIIVVDNGSAAQGLDLLAEAGVKQRRKVSR